MDRRENNKMKKCLLRAEKLKKEFHEGNCVNTVLNQTDLEIFEKDFTIIMGASGSGKSTLLYAVSGMDRVTDGRVFYRDIEISGLKERQMAKLRSQEFGFVFQQTHLVSNLTLMENILVAGYLSQKEKPDDVRKHTEHFLEQMNIQNAGNRLPSQVSGGEAQRAAIARAMIGKPGILFADEPTGALNRFNTIEVLNLLTDINRSGQSILMVTHDTRAAIRGNRILYLEDGKILDELTLPVYSELDEKERETAISQWLTKMHW